MLASKIYNKLVPKDLKNSYSLGISILRKRFRPLLGLINTGVYAKWERSSAM